MSLGVLGDVTFEVNKDKVLTWRNMNRSGSPRWAQHDVYAGKPVQEFIGPGLNQLRIDVRLDINRGITPKDTIDTLVNKRDSGEVLQFTVGGELIGKFVIRNLSEEWKTFSRTGTLVIADLAISLEEYN